MDFPQLLAGPIIRRTEEKKVVIWLATSQEYNIEPLLYELKITPENEDYLYIRMNIRWETVSIKMGTKLYITLVLLQPKESTFPLDQLIGYNLIFTNEDHSFDLGDLKLLNPYSPFSIVYNTFKLPTFFISTKRDNILFGSCRKLHGKGNDALLLGDKLMEKHCSELELRPNALFLIGDQIYADDVGDPVFPIIQRIKDELQVNEVKPDKFVMHSEAKSLLERLKKIRGRKTIVKEYCAFTTNNGENHLLTIGEFAAMYLLSLSPELWKWLQEEGHVLDFDSAVKGGYFFDDYLKSLNSEEELTGSLYSRRAKFMEQLGRIISFQETLPKVRRLLANIPTYMLFDDHDITDDWNISLQWKQDVENSPLGMHVIANALTAYWAFQGWGNVFDQYDPSFIKTIEKYLQAPNANDNAYDEWKNTLLTFPKWSFVAPTEPKALFLDTRTKRDFSLCPQSAKGTFIHELVAGPQLISEEGLSILTEQLKESGWHDSEPLILVSPVPLYGIHLIEQFLRDYVLPLKWLRLPVDTKFDLEAWKYNGKGYSLFQQWLSHLKIKKAVILSGDAHMAANVEATIHFPNGHKRTIEQFTSSPLKNNSFSLFLHFILKNLLRLYHMIWDGNNLYRGCNHAKQIHYKKDSPSSYLWEENIHYRIVSANSIMETENNLGIIKCTDGKFIFELLTGR